MAVYKHKPIPLPTIAAGVPPDRNRIYFEDSGALKFTPWVDRFNLVNAWWLAEAAMAAYEVYDPVLIAAISGFKEIDLNPITEAGYVRAALSKGNTQFLTIESKDVLIIAFRGTRLEGFNFPFLPKARAFAPNWGDIVTDAKFLPKVFDDDPSIFVHLGFYQAFVDIKDGLAVVVDKALNEGRPVWFCGHSLGAALATVAADAYRGRIAGLCTFGSPRVGNRSFVERLTEAQTNIWRFVHHRDVVTTVPPPTPRGFSLKHWADFFQNQDDRGETGYTHVGEPLYVAGGGDNWQIQSGGAARNTLGALAADAFCHAKGIANVLASGFSPIDPQTWPVAWDALADHAPIYYANKIFNALVDDLQGQTV